MDQGRPDGGRLRPRHPRRPRGEPADADQPRERRLPAGAHLRPAAPEREDLRRARRDLRGRGLLARPALCRHAGAARDRGRFRGRGADRDARPGSLRPRAAAAHRDLGRRPVAGGEGGRRHRRHRRLPPGDRGPPGDLPPDGELRHLRHADPSPGHRDRRAAPPGHRAGAARSHRGVPGRGAAQGDDRGTEGRDERDDRRRRLHQRGQPAGRGREVDGRRPFDDERRPVPRRPRHQQPGRDAREPLQQQPDGRSRSEPPLGQPVPEPVGDRWRRRDVLRHLDAEHLRHVGDADLGHDHRGARVPDVERAPRPLRDPDQERRELAHLRDADRGRARGERLRPAARDRGLREHHLRQLPPLPGHQLLPAVPAGREGVELAEHPVPQLPLLQQQQGVVRRGGPRPGVGRRDQAARVRVARRERRGRRRGGPPPRPGAFTRAGAGGGGAQAGRRLLQHLRRRRGPFRRFLLRRRPPPAHLPLGRPLLAPLGGARHPARAGEPRGRPGGEPDGRVVRRHRHRVLLQARFAHRPPDGSPGRRSGAAPRAGGGAPRRRLATGPRPGDRAGGAAAVPLPVTRRVNLPLRRARLHHRCPELGGEERRPPAVVRPGSRQPRAGVLRDERVGGHDLARHARRRRQPGGARGVRAPGGRRGCRGPRGPGLPRGGAHPGLRPGGPADRDHRDARAAHAGGLRGRRRPDAVHLRAPLALRRPHARGRP